MVWGPDPNLTPTGEEQAKAASTAWKTELKHGIPLPQKHYASPLQRALNTFRLTFQEGGFVDRSSLRVTILEVCSLPLSDVEEPHLLVRTYVKRTACIHAISGLRGVSSWTN